MNWLITNRLKLPPSVIILLAAAYISIFNNSAFFHKLLEAYPFDGPNWVSVISVFAVVLASMHLAISLFAFGRALKPVIIVFLLLSSLIRHFTESFGTVFDESMMINIFKTDSAEVADLATFGLLKYILVYGIFPSALVFLVKVEPRNFFASLKNRARDISVCILVSLFLILSSSKFYASFFREHKNLRSYVNPVYSIYSAGKYFLSFLSSDTFYLKKMGEDSVISSNDKGRDLIILVVGETARADRFSLNGYARETNPRLKQENILSFKDVWSCGTSTAVSVPCMFSSSGRSGYSDKKSRSTENLLDILGHTKRISVLWRDNNSDSKGVADRVPSEDFKSAPNNKICEGECRDVGMLGGLQEYIDRQTGDIFIVLHQMGNHGPAYYKRYPAEFEIFKPACHSTEFEKCSRDEINNAYDNAILYTDHFLAEVIALLKKNTAKFETGMIYVSDHGESLGENGIYLHGLPYFLAPDEQKKVPLFVWLDERLKSELNIEAVKINTRLRISHDSLFHTILGIFEVENTLYNKKLDILKPQ